MNNKLKPVLQRCAMALIFLSFCSATTSHTFVYADAGLVMGDATNFNPGSDDESEGGGDACAPGRTITLHFHNHSHRTSSLNPTDSIVMYDYLMTAEQERIVGMCEKETITYPSTRHRWPIPISSIETKTQAELYDSYWGQIENGYLNIYPAGPSTFFVEVFYFDLLNCDEAPAYETDCEAGVKSIYQETVIHETWSLLPGQDPILEPVYYWSEEDSTYFKSVVRACGCRQPVQ